MASITACEIKKGLSSLGIPMVTANCDHAHASTLTRYDRCRVTIGVREGVLISYHLAEPGPDEDKQVIVAFCYPSLHPLAPVQVQELVNTMFVRKEDPHERD